MKSILRVVLILSVILLVLVATALSLFFPSDRIEIDPDFPELSGRYLGQAPPGLTAERFAPGIVHSDSHTAVVFSPDGMEAYWSPMTGAVENMNDIVYMKLEGGRWSHPQVVPFASRFADSDNPCFSPDGKRLYFTSWRPEKWYQPFDSKERIWYVERTEEGWSKAQPVGAAINSMKLHWQLSVSENGALYFASGGDIYRSAFESGRYQDPQLLGSGVNSPSDEGHPYVAPDESFLIFSSLAQAKTRWDYDLYLSMKNDDGSWSSATNLGESINSPYQDIYPSISPDQEYLFFLSNRGGMHSIYWADFGQLGELIADSSQGE